MYVFKEKSEIMYCCGVANDSFIHLVTEWGRDVHCVVGVPGESDHTLLCWSYRVKAGEGTRSEVVTDTPKDFLVACCEINHASLTNQCLTRRVMWTAPDPRPIPE